MTDIMKPHLDPTLHHKTQNKRGFMHPITQIARDFILFSQQESPTLDMGCAYGNTVIAALDAGAKHVIACDMEQAHLDGLAAQLDAAQRKRVTLKQGVLPQGFDFTPGSIAGIHASLVLPYLSAQELDDCLNKFYQWLKPEGKLFILGYSIFIKEFANPHFEAEYEKRCAEGRKWPGYLEDFSLYSYTDGVRNELDAATFPMALHFFDLDVFVPILQHLGFAIEFAEYLDGPSNGALEDTWHDGRELVGIVVRKLL
jgi:SAM-dependent methyltransferase